jgi:hypothetical protein
LHIQDGGFFKPEILQRFLKEIFTLQVTFTEADISQNLTISIFLGTVETNFIQIMCEKRDRSSSKHIKKI